MSRVDEALRRAPQDAADAVDAAPLTPAPEANVYALAEERFPAEAAERRLAAVPPPPPPVPVRRATVPVHTIAEAAIAAAPGSSAAGVEAPAVKRVHVPDRVQAPDSVQAPDEDRRATLVAESFRTLRAQLLMRHARGLRSCMVTSARSQEGKSTIVANLAALLASSGHRTVIVDADLRRPNLHRILNCANDAGLREVLGNIRSLDAALQEVRPGLSLLSSGQIGSDPQALLLMNGLEETLRALEQRFDIVLLDSPPVLAVADGTLLAPHVGGVVVAVRSGTTTTGELRLVRERVIGAGGSLIGCVLSHVSPEDRDDYHPYASDYATPGGVAE